MSLLSYAVLVLGHLPSPLDSFKSVQHPADCVSNEKPVPLVLPHIYQPFVVSPTVILDDTVGFKLLSNTFTVVPLPEYKVAFETHPLPTSFILICKVRVIETPPELSGISLTVIFSSASQEQLPTVDLHHVVYPPVLGYVMCCKFNSRFPEDISLVEEVIFTSVITYKPAGALLFPSSSVYPLVAEHVTSIDSGSMFCSKVISSLSWTVNVGPAE